MNKSWINYTLDLGNPKTAIQGSFFSNLWVSKFGL